MVSGYLYLLAAVLAWSSYPVLAKVAYGLGMTPLTLGLLRFGLALPVLVLVLAVVRRAGPVAGRGGAGWTVLAQGAASAGAALTSLYAVRLLPASLATVLLYLCPAFTCLLAVLVFRERLTGSRLAALLITLAGVAAVVGPRGPAAVPAGGAAVAVFSALLSSAYFLLGQHNSRTTHPVAQAVVMAAVSLVLFAAARLALPAGEVAPGEAGRHALLVTGAIALLPTTLGPVMDLLGIRAVGAARAAIFITLEPAVALLLARWLLAERLTPAQALGAVLVVAGVLVLALGDYRERRTAAAVAPPGGRPAERG